MPSNPTVFLVSDDGRFYCNEQRNIEGALEFPDCDKSYDLPQHLGLHRFHHHNIKGASRRRGESSHPPKPRGRPPKRNGPLSAESICTTALELMAPGGNIPIHAIGDFNEWVRQTEAFLNKLLG